MKIKMMKTILVIAGMLVVNSMAGTLKDSRDGQTYKTVKIGNQRWMAENLNYKTSKSKCYDNKESNCKKYGRLYAWESAEEACPAGWHLPSLEEFKTLLATVGDPSGDKPENLRAGWWENGKDKYGFSALPAGDYGGVTKKFHDKGTYAYFWSSSESTGRHAWYLNINSYGATYDTSGKLNGSSVRCLQDSNPSSRKVEKNEEPTSNTMTDSRDGNTYKTVKIGKQTWMAKNLNVNVPGSMCWSNRPKNCEKYGRLYTWEAARNACPSGWHLPSKEEMLAFGEAVTVRVDQIVTQKKLNAESLKKGEGKLFNHLRDSSWKDGLNTFGFSALPAGSYSSGSKEFYYLGYSAYFWSSTEEDSRYALRLLIEVDGAGVDYNGVKLDAYSVRCLQDSN